MMRKEEQTIHDSEHTTPVSMRLHAALLAALPAAAAGAPMVPAALSLST